MSRKGFGNSLKSPSPASEDFEANPRLDMEKEKPAIDLKKTKSNNGDMEEEVKVGGGKHSEEYNIMQCRLLEEANARYATTKQAGEDKRTRIKELEDREAALIKEMDVLETALQNSLADHFEQPEQPISSIAGKFRREV